MTSKRLTITDIAKMAQTSTATVSHYLNGKYEKMGDATRKRIERVIEETGYVPNAPAQHLASGSSKVIAVLIEDNTNVWAGELVSGVESVAHENGYQTVVCDTHFDPKTERDYVEKMLAFGVDGIIIQPTNHYRSVNERLKRAGKPVVFYDFSLMDLSSTWVKTDLYAGVYDAISSCADSGYEDFVVLADESTGLRTRSERMAGFTDALDERGIAYRSISVTHEGATAERLRSAFDEQINPARRTLVFCLHQWALAVTFKALDTRRHLMPGRVGLLGLNNGDWADLTEPGISTIIEPVELQGRTACQMLVDRIKDPEAAPQQQMLSCRTRWLGSTLPQPGRA